MGGLATEQLYVTKCAWTCSWVGQLRTSSCALAWKLHTHTVATALLYQTKRGWTKTPCERKQSCPSEIPAENVFLFKCPSLFTKTHWPTVWILNPCLKHPPQLLAAVTVGRVWGPSFVSCYDMHFMERPGFWPCWAHTALRLGAPRESPSVASIRVVLSCWGSVRSLRSWRWWRGGL